MTGRQDTGSDKNLSRVKFLPDLVFAKRKKLTGTTVTVKCPDLCFIHDD